MMRINDYYLKKLEFDKIQSMLADFAVITNTKERCLKLRPYDDINVLNEVLNEVDEALKIILRMSSAPIIITSNLLPIIVCRCLQRIFFHFFCWNKSINLR